MFLLTENVEYKNATNEMALIFLRLCGLTPLAAVSIFIFDRAAIAKNTQV